MLIAESILIFLFGLCAGSFLNVVALRLLKGEGLRGRSRCQKCLKTLKWYELVPLASFVAQKGKCRGCLEKISWQYPLVELASGFIFLILFNHFYGSWIDLVIWILGSSVLIILFITDIQEYILPDSIVLPVVLFLILYRVFQAIYLGSFIFFVNFVLVSFFISLPFFLFYLISRGKWMGMGDSKLIFFIGLLSGWPKSLIAVMLAVFLGALWGMIGMFLTRFTPTFLSFIYKKISGLFDATDKSAERQRKNKAWRYTLKSMMPFGPFIIIGAFISLYFGDIIYEWYVSRIFLAY